ncbi:proteasome inhibitor PI31 subunit [Scleropages formosus]|uniref:Proteasome inhibitor PI31 subunit n=1 Tax=Scleropages formosus TaxID=113540 RepID=A0A8C9VHX2_SCLFO|nr:proteasome inhibitor PI31 subunit [Scleropages formosus]
MAGLELLYNSVASSISCPQDVLVCFVHWEIVRRGYKCLGVGDEPQTSDKKSELLPQGWNGNKELYTLRYQSSDDKSRLLVKAITVDSSLIFNLMDMTTEQVSDLTVNVSDYVDADNLLTFDRVLKNTEELKTKVQTGLLSQMFKQKTESKKKVEKSERERTPDWGPDHDPLRIPPRRPLAGRDPSWPDPMAPFAAGRADLDPLSGQPGGMIMDPLRSGFPRSGFDPSAGIPGRLPPGAVPPGARFDPFGPIGQNRPGPDPDHMPPPGYDDMFM